jgi:hypothetical protein
MSKSWPRLLVFFAGVAPHLQLGNATNLQHIAPKDKTDGSRIERGKVKDAPETGEVSVCGCVQDSTMCNAVLSGGCEMQRGRRQGGMASSHLSPRRVHMKKTGGTGISASLGLAAGSVPRANWRRTRKASNNGPVQTVTSARRRANIPPSRRRVKQNTPPLSGAPKDVNGSKYPPG